MSVSLELNAITQEFLIRFHLHFAKEKAKKESNPFRFWRKFTPYSWNHRLTRVISWLELAKSMNSLEWRFWGYYDYDSTFECYKEKRRFSMSNTSFLWQRYDEVVRGKRYCFPRIKKRRLIFKTSKCMTYKISLAIQAQASASARAWWWFSKQ